MDEISEKSISGDIINNLAILLRTSHVHDINNTAVVNQMEKFISLLNGVFSEDRTLRIDLVGEIFHVNNERVRYPLEYLLNFDYLFREFKKRGLGTIIFEDSVEMQGFKIFVKSFISANSSDKPFEVIHNAVSSLRGIEVDRLKSVEEQDRDIRKIVKRTYFNAVAFSKGELNKLKAKDAANMKKTKRIIRSIVDLMVGVFPVGTLVMLNTQELGIVCENNPLFIDRPKVCIIADEKGTKSDYIVDLSERTPDGRYARNIIKTLDSNKYRINLAEHLFVSHPGPFRQMEN